MGKANWWLPGWLDRLLPHISLESDGVVRQHTPAVVPAQAAGSSSSAPSREVEPSGAPR
jgi:RND superfamily putative drug exporter